MMLGMRLFAKHTLAETLEQMPETVQTAISSVLPGRRSSASQRLMATVSWVSAGLGAVALGLFVGRELRIRYKFNRRTPYDFYAHSGDEEAPDVEFGVGI